MPEYGIAPSYVAISADELPHIFVRVDSNSDGENSSDYDRSILIERNIASINFNPSEYLYIGYEYRFDAIIIWPTVEGSYQYEIYDGTNWIEVVPVIHGGPQSVVSPERFDQSTDMIVPEVTRSYIRFVQFDLKNPRFYSWGSYELPITNSTPASERYWIRIFNTEDTTFSSIAIRPYISTTTVEEVQHLLQFNEPFGSESFPSYNTVEDHLRAAEDSIFRVTGHYYRPELIEAEFLPFKAFGMTLRFRPVLEVLEVAFFNGDTWDIQDEGREEQWHYDGYTGILYLSGYFLGTTYPPSLRRGYSARREQGSFKRGVRVRYIFGHDTRIDPRTSELGHVVIKQAAVDILLNHDFARLLPQGLDRATINDKIANWEEDVRDFKERYSKIALF